MATLETLKKALREHAETLSTLMEPLINARSRIPVLEIGPGPESVLGLLPEKQRRLIRSYTAIEPNKLFLSCLENCLQGKESLLPGLDRPPTVRPRSFRARAGPEALGNDKFDLILFCYSMYGIEPKRDYIERALGMLLDNDKQLLGDGLVVVFHRDTLTDCVSNECVNVDSFVQFISGCTVEGHGDVAKVTAEGNRASLCRSLGRSEGNCLIFSAPEVMLAFTRHAAFILELISQMPALFTKLRRKPSLPLLGEAHSGHCIVPNIVAIDMCSFNNVHVAPTTAGVSLIIVEAGANSGDIIIKGMTEGLTVLLGSRPSGIGHLVRMYGLTCDSVVGAVLVSADSGDIVYVGSVPSHLECDILWAIKGAGTNFGVVVSVVFRSCPVSTFLLRRWKCLLFNDAETMHRVRRFDKEVARKLPRKCSSDAYLYYDTDTDKLYLGQFSSRIKGVLGLAAETRVVDCNGLFETDMYMSGMQYRYGGGKTSSFKRCVFLKDIGSADTTLQAMVNAMNMRPTPLCYLHLLHGGGSEGVVHNVRSDATAFGCRDWDFACVVTGVWLRDHDGSDEPRQVQQWVYDVVLNLLTLDSCSGVYPADLGPDPRDASLVLKAFGPNRLCLARLKKTLDLYNTIYRAGKDYCADLWTSFFHIEQKSLTTRLVSISTAIKREYVEAFGANLKRLLTELTLIAFWEKRVRERQNLAEEIFLNCVYNAAITGMRDEALVANVSYLVPNSRVVEVYVRADNETMRSDDSFDAAPNTLNYIPDFIFDNHASGDINVKNFTARYLVLYSGKRDGLRRLESMIRCVPNFLHHGQLGGIPLADIDAIVSCESGGFIFASALAGQGVDIPLVIIRKARKFPPPVVLVAKGQLNISHVSSESTGSGSSGTGSSCSRALGDEEEERVEMERHTIPAPEGASVLVVDDVLASGRTLYAVLSLLREVGVEAGRISVIVVAEFPEVGFGQVRVQSLLVFGGV
ncbi:hypothetical protein V8F33_008447 [Rhypophila sp. PSN 637]